MPLYVVVVNRSRPRKHGGDHCDCHESEDLRIEGRLVKVGTPGQEPNHRYTDVSDRRGGKDEPTEKGRPDQLGDDNRDARDAYPDQRRWVIGRHAWREPEHQVAEPANAGQPEQVRPPSAAASPLNERAKIRPKW
jgi:hypothetical protein